MRKKSLILPVVLALLFGQRAHAADLENLLREARARNLAQNPTWLKLLHFEFQGAKSVVLTDDFFISPEGRNDPVKELDATIRAYFTPWADDNGNHPRCVYPARYFWLSHHLDLPGYDLRSGYCQKLENWALFDKVNSISVLLVSGYLGNPASTFGHGLLKFNTDSADDTKGMFDLTLNYGAVVPENEMVLRYVFRGLFGGYIAGFSDKYFYTQDLVYSRTEFRDIWNYTLALTDYERT